MSRAQFVDIGQLLNEVEASVASIEQESGRFLFGTDTQAGSDSRLRVLGAEALEALVEKPRDGLVELEVSPDAMEVRASVYPPAGGGQPLTLEQFEAQLEKLGVYHGLLVPEIRRILSEAALDLKAAFEVVIAKGTPPTESYPERWTVHPALLEKQRTLEADTTSIDQKQRSPFVLVKKGDSLAQKIPEQAGAQGHDVYNKPLEFSRIVPRVLQPGRNVESRPDGYFAACDGCFKSTDSLFWVDEVLVLDSGVGYATGNIDFPGDVQVVGDIASGFRIRAQGSLHSTRVLDATEVVAGGDVTTALGIVGHGDAVVKAEGRVRAKFVENVVVLARGPLEIQSSALNCVLQTLDKLVMGEKGVLVGGKVIAQNGIDVFQVGTERASAAEIICGMDFTVLDKVAWSRDQSLSLVKQLKTLEAHKKSHPEQAEAIGKACARLRNQVMQLGELARGLVGQIDKNDDVEIVIRGHVFQGTYLEICHVSHVVPKTVSAMRYVLDKIHGKVKGLPL